MRRQDLDALWALTAILIRRLLREGLVLRSLIWPSALAGGTLMATLAVAALLQVSVAVAIPEDAAVGLEQDLSEAGWDVLRSADPTSEVLSGDAWAATDGRNLWFSSGGDDAVRLEALLRKRAGSGWTPIPAEELPGTPEAAMNGSRVVRMLTLLFALYGVVFGLGMVARDRDDGTLEAELSLPIARWVPGGARWLAGTVVLALFLAYCVALFDALVGVEDAPALFRHGYAAAGGSLTLGLAVIGDAGTRRGFSGPLALGLTGATGLLGFGATGSEFAQWIPLASVMAGGDGWIPALLATLSGGLASAVFAWRSARA